MYRYNVNNSAPRPESYLTGGCFFYKQSRWRLVYKLSTLQIIDYLTANDPSLQPPLSDLQKADLYAELASGGETGWDFSMRWFTGSPSNMGGLVSLNIRNIIGPDLNAILCEFYYLSAFQKKKKMMQLWFYATDKNRLTLASLYGSSNETAAQLHTTAAASLKAGILDLLWDADRVCCLFIHTKIRF